MISEGFYVTLKTGIMAAENYYILKREYRKINLNLETVI